MKNVTIVITTDRPARSGLPAKAMLLAKSGMIATSFCALLMAGAAPAVAHVARDEPRLTAMVSDLPVASPRRLVQPDAALGENRQMSGTSYFYAPGSGPRCEIRMKRVQGRIYQACE